MTKASQCHRPHSSRHKSNAPHPFRAPEEEEELAHVHMSIRFVLICFGLVPFSTYLLAIWVAAHPHLTAVDMNPNFTSYVRDTFQFNETGNGEIWVYAEDGSKTNLGVFWNRFYVLNMSHYTFGHGNSSFCNKRNETFEHDWSTSIFRASQLYSSVQTGMRYGLLIAMLPMILNAYITAKTVFIEQKTLATALIGAAYVCNEILLYIAYFLLSALHVEFDKRDLPYTTTYFSVAMFLSIAKLILRNFTEPLGLTAALRCVGVVILIFSYSPLQQDIQDYADNVYCDTFTSPLVSALQLVCILLLFFNNLYDVHESRIFHLVVSPTSEDVSVQKRQKTSVFRRDKKASRL